MKSEHSWMNSIHDDVGSDVEHDASNDVGDDVENYFLWTTKNNA
jgi:hypothetical protein